MQNTDSKARLTLGDLDGISLVQLPSGKVAAVSSEFSYSKLTGLAKVTKPDGTVVNQWQCLMSKSATGAILGWLWPTIMQADLPAPDVNVTDTGGTLVGKAYSTPIPGYWDIPVADLGGTITHYAASGLLPDGNYVEVQDLAGTTLYHILAP